jgi:hypothetical protein
VSPEGYISLQKLYAFDHGEKGRSRAELYVQLALIKGRDSHQPLKVNASPSPGLQHSRANYLDQQNPEIFV